MVGHFVWNTKHVARASQISGRMEHVRKEPKPLEESGAVRLHVQGTAPSVENLKAGWRTQGAISRQTRSYPHKVFRFRTILFGWLCSPVVKFRETSCPENCGSQYALGVNVGRIYRVALRERTLHVRYETSIGEQ